MQKEKFNHPGLIGAQVSTGPREKQVAYYMGELGREINAASEAFAQLRDDMHMVLQQRKPFDAKEGACSDGVPQPSTPLAAELNIFLQNIIRLNADIKEVRDRLEA
jgi:hypothetical protein